MNCTGAKRYIRLVHVYMSMINGADRNTGFTHVQLHKQQPGECDLEKLATSCLKMTILTLQHAEQGKGYSLVVFAEHQRKLQDAFCMVEGDVS